jgi:hypothetical protein
LRETLKSLSIFSAMLLLLLLISSGCDVNIPGCGKRSLPFFKKVSAPPQAPSETAAPQAGTGGLEVQLSGSAPQAQVPTAVTSAPPQTTKVPVSTTPVPKEMSVTSAPPTKAPTASPTPTATPWEVERIAYTTLEKGKPTLWSMSTDGTSRERLTPVGTGCWFPLWSPNGKTLAFLSDMKGGTLNLFIQEKGSKEVRQLTELTDMTLPKSKGMKAPFSWSPKSDEVVYCYKHQVWKVNLMTGIHQTLAELDRANLVEAVEWAPRRENKFVAFLAKKGEAFYALTVVNPRLLDSLVLSEINTKVRDISWTSDARNVAYLKDDNEVLTSSPETSSPKMILNHACEELAPFLSYSPQEGSGTLMVLAKKTSGEGYRVATMEKASTGPTDTGTLKYLTDPGVDGATWSPDGANIAYTQSVELWVMDVNGANKKRLAATGILYPQWSKK